MSCKAEVQGFDAGYCLGVVEGVMASMRVCKQDHSAITLGEAADALEKYLSSHPDKLNERDVVLARKALSKAYPCGLSGSKALTFLEGRAYPLPPYNLQGMSARLPLHSRIGEARQ